MKLKNKTAKLFLAALLAGSMGWSAEPSVPIDRQAVVTRHNVKLSQPGGLLQVGNGHFAFNADVSGLQSFSGDTLSNWGWHEAPLPDGMKPEDRKRTEFMSHGRKRYYLSDQNALDRWLYDNPHRANLGRLRFVTGQDAAVPLTPQSLKNIRQKLDLWSGLLVSEYELNGQPVHVETVCHPVQDTVAVRIVSPLLASGELSVMLDFPYPTRTGNDWGRPESHVTQRTRTDGERADFVRKADAMEYHVALAWSEGAALHDPVPEPPLKSLVIGKAEYGAETTWVDVTGAVTKAIKNDRLSITVNRGALGVQDFLPKVRKQMKVSYTLGGEALQAVLSDGQTFQVQSDSKRHCYRLSAGGRDTLTAVCAFSAKPVAPKLPSFEETRTASAGMWKTYWTSGGAMDLSGSKDPRCKELERRIVLSQYLMRVNSAGSMPPPEIGLHGFDQWASKFHLEMTAWHGAHFMLWGRPECVKGWVQWFQDVGLPSAEREAQAEGWKGAKWLKMSDPYGRWESWAWGPNRVTQNAHPFYWAELFYRDKPTHETLEQWKKILFETATMMADFVAWDERSGRYILGPPVMSGAEGNSGFQSWNSTSELNYWAMSLEIAQKWRERLGQPRDPKWDHILTHLSRPPVKDGVYIDAESHPAVWNQGSPGRFLRPAWFEVYGCIRGPMIDPAIMEKTYERAAKELRSGEWKGNLWGCDYPMMAMTAARLGKTKEAMDWLLQATPRNKYSPNGFCSHWYLPGNGGLLWAVAMMAAGWDGAPAQAAPGFPNDGSWVVKWEGLKPAP